MPDFLLAGGMCAVIYEAPQDDHDFSRIEPLTLPSGSKLALYEILALLGAGGMSACGCTHPRPCEAEARCQRQFAAGVGPARQTACGHAEPRTWKSEARGHR